MMRTPPLLRKDVKLGEGVNLQRWAVVKRIGDGGFAEVYEVLDTFKDDEKFAVKIDKLLDKRKDRRSGGTVKTEIQVLRQLQSCPPVCRLVPEGEGTYEGRFYMIMELLGANLAEIRHSSPQGRIQPQAAKKIALDLLNALEGVHKAGYIHRDVKPANFALYQGPGARSMATGGDWRIIDFGIARRFVDDDGNPLPKREAFGEFRGSTTYASIHAHLKQDLGRRDDLWSWLYIVVEMLEGTLPWRTSSGDASANSEHSPKETAQRLKQEALENPHILSITGKLSEPLVAISAYLRSTFFETEPDYDLLQECIASLPSMPAVPEQKPPAAANGHVTPPHPPPQHPPGRMWPPAAPATAPPPMFVNGAAHPAMHAMPPMANGSYAQLPPAAYMHMPVRPHDFYWRGYGAATQHSAPLQHAAVNYMHGYAGNAPAQAPPAPITLSAPVPRPAPPRPPANGSAQQQQPRIPDRAAARPAAASASDFDMDDQLGHIGSAFDDEEFDFGQHNSSSRAAKRSRTGEEELAGDGHASKRARFGQAVCARQQRLGQQLVQQPREGVGEGLLEMKEMAAMAARGQLSQGAMEVRNKLRQLDPAEGLSILAWLVDALSRNVQHDGTPQVVQWLGKLAAFSDECAVRCQATRARPQEA
ncbi:g1720 [Coccomyxa elongata]